MMRTIIFLVLTIFIFKQSSSQIKTSEKGLTTVVFDTKYAVVTVYLPDDLQDGDKIYGTYFTYTAGMTDEQLEQSLAAVRKYKFNFSNPVNHTNVMQTFISCVPNTLMSLLPIKVTKSLILSLSESYTKTYRQELKPIPDPILPVDGCILPQHILLGNPLRIIGTFDGNGGNTRVSINNTIFPVLAESPRQCIVELPEKLNIPDTVEIKILEDFKPKCVQKVIPVKMHMSYDKIKVKKNETANVFISINGLQGLEDTSVLIIENQTPDIISMKNGNKQEIKITPNMLTGSKEYKLTLPVTGINSGELSVQCKLIIPEDFPPDIER